MDNPLSKLAPQLFGEYPKPFVNLIENLSLGPGQDIKDVEGLSEKIIDGIERKKDLKYCQGIIKRSLDSCIFIEKQLDFDIVYKGIFRCLHFL